MSSISGVGNRGGPRDVSEDNPAVPILPVPGGLKELEEAEATMDDCELSVESEKLVSLRARLLRSFPSFWLPSLPSTGLGKSKPNCSKDRLKDVVLGWRDSWSCGGQLEDMLAGDKGYRFLLCS